ncbi:hypothetical protein GE09DRAFT_108773 [Coniochaeta sp. 2T2.1]|nr:hypothetical protein GE09DRAFT_108773 [Coniochaeta sp. 2T2.1]
MSSDAPRTVRFTNFAALCTLVDDEARKHQDSLAVTHVSLDTLLDITKRRDLEGRRFRFRFFDTKSQIVIITIPTPLDEQCHGALYNMFRDQLVRNDQELSWTSKYASTYKAPQDSIFITGKEGDSCGGPRPERGGSRAWPTLVIEAGVSELLSQLRLDMRWWFSHSHHEVKIVLIVKFSRQDETLLIERWEEDYVPRQEATATRQQTLSLEPVMPIQTITIRQVSANPASYNVTRGDLVLPFKLLFLRDPGPSEADFVITIQKLDVFAQLVWEYRD